MEVLKDGLITSKVKLIKMDKMTSHNYVPPMIFYDLCNYTMHCRILKMPLDFGKYCSISLICTVLTIIPYNNLHKNPHVKHKSSITTLN